MGNEYSARWAEVARRMEADGVPEALRPFRDAQYMRQVVEDEATGAWTPEADAPASAPSSAAPAVSAPVLPPVANPAARECRSRSIWSQAIAEANAEAQGDPAPVDPKTDAVPAGSAARSRSAWGRAVAEANSELIRRGGRIGEA